MMSYVQEAVAIPTLRLVPFLRRQGIHDAYN